MARQIINIGTTANDRTGDPLRIAFGKSNDNFAELYANVATLTSAVVTDVSDLTDTQNLLFSGNYQDLANTPFIATDISDLTDSSNLLIEKNNIILTGVYQGSNTVISFEKQPNTDPETVFDSITEFITITRDVGGIGGAGGGIYNSTLEEEWDPAVSPLFTLWNTEGWSDLSDIETRYYQPFRQALQNNIGLNVVGAELIMKDTLANEYYKFKFSSWAQGPAHTGAFAYTREKIDTTTPIGITFYDGSKLPKAPDTKVRFEQAYIGDYGDHVLNITEAGRQIYTYNNILEIPSFVEQDFKLGDTIQIVTAQTASTIRPKVNNDVEIPDATLYIQGESTAVSSFLIPARSMALLTKIRENTWQLSIGNALVIDNSANTGDITFDGIKIIGAGTASGDGNGYSTIELVPDNSLYDNDQFLVIDPTQPNHIHVRAGGTQDDSGAELFLGGEKNNVRVIDGVGVRLYNEVRDDVISSFSDPSDFNTATWYGTPGNYFVEFTQVTAGMGNLAFAFGNDDENRVTVSYGVGESAVLTYGGSTSNLGGGVYRFAVVEAPPVSPTSLTAIEFQIWSTNDNRVELQYNDFTVEVEDDVRITGNDTFSLRNRSTTEGIEIRTDYDNADRIWIFGANGTMETPGDIVVSGDVTGTTGASTLYLKAQAGSNTYIQLNNSVDSTISTVANLAIRTDVSNTSYVWTFGTDGSLTFPDSTVQTTAYTGDYLDLSNTPSLISEFDNDVGYLTANSLPTNISELTNDVGYLTAIPSSVSVDTLSINDGVYEQFQSKADATGIVEHDCSFGHIFYHISPDANWTANFTNLNLSSTYATTVTLIIMQGGTGYYPNAVQIGGVNQTINWQDNTTPTPSTNRTDVVTFSILNTGTGYVVLGQLTGF